MVYHYRTLRRCVRERGEIRIRFPDIYIAVYEYCAKSILYVVFYIFYRGHAVTVEIHMILLYAHYHLGE